MARLSEGYGRDEERSPRARSYSFVVESEAKTIRQFNR